MPDACRASRVRRGLYNGSPHAATREDVRRSSERCPRQCPFSGLASYLVRPFFHEDRRGFPPTNGGRGPRVRKRFDARESRTLRAAVGELGVAVRRVLWQVERVCRRARLARGCGRFSELPETSHQQLSDRRAGRVGLGSVQGQFSRFRDQKGSERDRFGTGFLSRSQRVFGRNAGQAESWAGEGGPEHFVTGTGPAVTSR